MDSHLSALMDQAARVMDSDPNIHRVGWGYKTVNGKATGEQAIIFTVKRKLSPETLRAQGRQPIPKSIANTPLNRMGITRTDVVEEPEAHTLELDLAVYGVLDLAVHGVVGAYGQSAVHRQCHDCPIPGGVQIQPQGESWVGTLAWKVVAADAQGRLFHAAVTNWHVATGDVGRKLHQPDRVRDWFAEVAYSPGIDFNGENLVDAAVLSIRRTDGPYSPVTHTVRPEMVTLGPYGPEPVEPRLGMQLARDGRTLGRKIGRVTEIGSRVRVGYGVGKTALFVNQIVAQGVDGDFSAPGDSGSGVQKHPTGEPVGLLFAGGGGTTILSPAAAVMSECRVQHFK